MNIQPNGWATTFVLGLCYCCGAACLPAYAQQQQRSSTESQPARGIPGSGEISSKSADSTTGTSNDRLFYALPNFLTLENAGQLPPLSSKENLRWWREASFDYVEYPWYGFLAGISQAENSEPGYGQGAEGYGKRLRGRRR